MLYVIYRMTIIYNPSTGFIAKIIFKIEIKKINKSLKATIVVLQSSVLSAHLSFWFVLCWVTEAPLLSPNEWQKYLLTQEESWRLWMQRSEREVLQWHLEVFGVWVMSTDWTNLNGTMTDSNLYWLVWRATNRNHWALKAFTKTSEHKRRVWPNKQRM